MTKIDIKALARELKSGQGSTVSSESLKVEAQDKKSIQRSSIQKTSMNLKQFVQILNEANNREDFNSDGCVYIDSELYDLLRQIKLRNKLKIGHLVSWLIEQFVVEHQKEISDLLKVKKNKYMD